MMPPQAFISAQLSFKLLRYVCPRQLFGDFNLQSRTAPAVVLLFDYFKWLVDKICG
jgi:hypothetical protein